MDSESQQSAAQPPTNRSNTYTIAGVVVILVIVVGIVGAYYLIANSASTNTSIAYDALKNITTSCNLTGVTQITMTNNVAKPPVLSIVNISNGNVTSYNAPGYGWQELDYKTPADAILPVCGSNDTINYWMIAAQQVGGNVDGKWFTYTNSSGIIFINVTTLKATKGAITGYFRINITGPLVVLESRNVYGAYDGFSINATEFQQIRISNSTHRILATSLFWIPGQNPMITESYTQIMQNTSVAEYDTAGSRLDTAAGQRALNFTSNDFEVGGWINFTYTDN